MVRISQKIVQKHLSGFCILSFLLLFFFKILERSEEELLYEFLKLLLIEDLLWVLLFWSLSNYKDFATWFFGGGIEFVFMMKNSEGENLTFYLIKLKRNLERSERWSALYLSYSDSLLANLVKN